MGVFQWVITSALILGEILQELLRLVLGRL
jgi:hypothetical protein